MIAFDMKTNPRQNKNRGYMEHSLCFIIVYTIILFNKQYLCNHNFILMDFILMDFILAKITTNIC